MLWPWTRVMSLLCQWKYTVVKIVIFTFKWKCSYGSTGKARQNLTMPSSLHVTNLPFMAKWVMMNLGLMKLTCFINVYIFSFICCNIFWKDKFLSKIKWTGGSSDCWHSILTFTMVYWQFCEKMSQDCMHRSIVCFEPVCFWIRSSLKLALDVENRDWFRSRVPRALVNRLSLFSESAACIQYEHVWYVDTLFLWISLYWFDQDMNILSAFVNNV